MTETQQLPEGVWRRDPVPGGHRDWLTDQRVLTEPDQFRTLIETGISNIRWYPPTGAAIPMWPALALREIVQAHELRWVGGLGVSPTPLEFPEDNYLRAYLDHGVEPMWATYSILGVRTMTREGWQIPYYLDKGMELVCIAVDVVAVDRPPVLSMACALNRHQECTGSSRSKDESDPERLPCPCDCGCRDRSRGGAGDRTEQRADEPDDLKPNRQAGTVTHNEPPETE
ncbi:hypothetical protein [Nocardia transvalensis]|uniref:hypothetical protein n=1 Tax=Nocardia transvalensis TaxID=37333 RepID=UPI001894FE5A|nr:hypothetical protein [Nocardia transvalensis]MBF6333341.1 hypothetical protein [Nocardia transvalensis]